MKIKVGDMRRLVREALADIDKTRLPKGPNSRDDAEDRPLDEGSRDPYHPDYDEAEATRYAFRRVEDCKDRLASAIDQLEKLIGPDAEVLGELRDIMFDLHDIVR